MAPALWSPAQARSSREPVQSQAEPRENRSPHRGGHRAVFRMALHVDHRLATHLSRSHGGVLLKSNSGASGWAVDAMSSSTRPS